jgi:hypothetical protein
MFTSVVTWKQVSGANELSKLGINLIKISDVANLHYSEYGCSGFVFQPFLKEKSLEQ